MIVTLASSGLRNVLKTQLTKISVNSIRYARTHAQAKMRQTTVKAPKFASGTSGILQNVLNLFNGGEAVPNLDSAFKNKIFDKNNYLKKRKYYKNRQIYV